MDKKWFIIYNLKKRNHKDYYLGKAQKYLANNNWETYRNK